MQNGTCHSGCICAKVGQGLEPRGISPPDWVTMAEWEPPSRKFEGLHVEGKLSLYPWRAQLAAPLSTCTREARASPSQGTCLLMVSAGRQGQVDTTRDSVRVVRWSLACDFLRNVHHPHRTHPVTLFNGGHFSWLTTWHRRPGWTTAIDLGGYTMGNLT